MANKTEYEMLWKLGAQLGKDFSGTFTSAQKILVATQKEIQALNKQQSDIAGYSRQQQSIEKSNQKLELYQEQLANVRKEMSQNTEYSSALANKEAELQSKIKSTESEIASKSARLKEMGDDLTASGVDVSNLSGESERLKKKLEDLKKAEEDAGKEAEQFGNSGSSAFEAVGSAIVAAGIAAALKEISQEYKECVKIAADFEETMSTVEALSGASAGELGSLTEMAKQLGATTKFTAKESAEAMSYMAMAGWDAEQMVSGMDGVLQLAAASGEDLGTVADIVTDALTAFGLSASDTAHFSDVLATTATNANTNVAMMGETFKYAAPLAGALGYSVEDVATMIGLMANSGIKGSQAGTALRKMFGELREGATLTASTFGEYTVETQNADGTMRDLGDVINDLREKFALMTDAEKAANAEALVGDRAMTGFIAIMNSSSADFDKLAGSIENCTGSAKKMADIRLDNLNGQLTLMNSAADALRTTVGEAFAPELKALAKIGTEILSGINEFAEKHPIILKSLIALGAEALVIVGVYTAYTTIKKVHNALSAVSAALKAKETAATVAETAATTAQAAATTGATAAQTALNVAMMANPIGIVIAAVGALTVGIIALATATKDATQSEKELTATSREQYEELQSLNAEYENACKLYGETSEEAKTLRGEYMLLQEEYEASKKSLSEFNAELEANADELAEFLSNNRSNVQAINDEEAKLFALVARLDALDKQTNKTNTQIAEMSTIVDLLNQSLPTLNLTIDSTTGKINNSAEAIRKLIEAEIARDRYEQNYADAKELYTKLIDYQNDYTEAVKNTKKAEEDLAAIANSATYKEALEAVKHVADEVSGRQYASKYGAIMEQYNKAAEKVGKLQKAEEKAKKTRDEAQSKYDELIGAIVGYNESLESSTAETEEAASVSDDLNDALLAVRLGYLDVSKSASLYGVNSDALQKAVESASEYEEALKSAMKATEDGFYSAEEAAKAYGVTVDDLKTYTEIKTTIDSIDELSKAYVEAKEAAEKSIQGQFELWDTAAVVIPTNIATINTALETQMSYWSDYNTDLQKLIGRTGDVEGLSEVIATFADGSKESVNAIAGMAAASDEDLRTMVANWLEVKRQQQAAADSLVDLTTEYEDQIAALEQDLTEAVDALHLEDETADAAKATLDAYTEAIKNGTDDAVKAAERLASLVATALQFNGTVSVSVNGTVSQNGSTSSSGAWSSYEDAASAGFSNIRTRSEFARGNNPDKEKYGTYQAYLDAMYQKYVGASTSPSGSTGGGARGVAMPANPYLAVMNAYAVGTVGAAPGLALVGEKGPELVAFGGGESVYTAEETKEILDAMRDYTRINAYAVGTGEDMTIISFLPTLMSMMKAETAQQADPAMAERTGNGTVHITVSPSYTIEGGGNDDIEERLRGLSDDIVEMVLDAIDEAGIDTKRGVYT